MNLLWKILQTLAIRKDQKAAKRNLTVYLPLFMSYIDDYDICIVTLLFMFMIKHYHLA